ncbi:hypothetical protein ELH40_36335 (plasmid) [Rhizobium ruizarguesonis]|uniref:Cytochrome P460 domain-containing protein n=1 Tax=Rhizobium ruizarguesonis TaxID=2081791 RepID=A0AB38HSE9_9HYPH|nr:hypothetical protein ELH40_36335 [Rhizobium ruizarguesonis]
MGSSERRGPRVKGNARSLCISRSRCRLTSRTDTFPTGRACKGSVSYDNARHDNRNVSNADTLAAWFVMVKDNAGRFPDNKLWGDGWRWSWFDASNPRKTTSTDYTTDCQSCHQPGWQSDWIYSLGYPALKR